MSNKPILMRISQTLPVILIALGTIVLAAYVALEINTGTKIKQVTIAAGSPNSEAFTLMKALKAVTERYYPRYKIVIYETGGTFENIQALERGEAQLATAQADGMASPNARTVAVLYNDVFQILAHKEANIQQFAQLKGKKIAVPRHGGQFQTFMNIAAHYSLDEGDFTFLGPTDESADLAYVKGDADAIFRVRPLPNDATARLAATGNPAVVPIEQASAIHLEYPAYTPMTIPVGACLGNPPVPDADIISISAPRFLVAHNNADYALVYAITQVLMERRQDLIAAISETQAAVRPLAANAQPPNARVGLGSAIHQAARDYYDRNHPSFAARNSDWIAAFIGFAILLGLWFWALSCRRKKIQIAVAGEYQKRIVALIKEIQEVREARELQPIQKELVSLVPRALVDLGENRLSAADVQIIRSMSDFGIGIIRQNNLFSAGTGK